MLKNSELFFIKAKDFQNKRKEIMDTYENPRCAVRGCTRQQVFHR